MNLSTTQKSDTVVRLLIILTAIATVALHGGHVAAAMLQEPIPEPEAGVHELMDHSQHHAD